MHALQHARTTNRFHLHQGAMYGILAALTFSAYVLINRAVYVHHHVPTFDYTATFLVSGALVGAISLSVQRLRGAPRPNFKNSRLVVVNGLIAGTGIGLMVVGQAFTTAINTSIIATSTVLTTAFFSWVFLKEKFTQRQMIWLIVMFVGIYFAITGGRLISFNKGDMIVFLAIVVLGFTNVFSKLLMKNHASGYIADIRLVSGGVLFGVLGLAARSGSFLVTSAGWWPLLAGLLFWLTIRFAYGAIHLTSPNEAMVLSNGHPFFTAVFGMLLLSEPYSWIKFVSSAVILLSIYFITKKSRRATITPAAELP